MKTAKKHSLIWWLEAAAGIFLSFFAVLLAVFGHASMKNLMGQEIAGRSEILKLNVSHVNRNLASLEKSLYQVYDHSEEIVRLETGGDPTRMFMARQELTGSLSKILGQSESLQFLFFYAPQSEERTFIRVTPGNGTVLLDDALEKKIREYVDIRQKNERAAGRGYMLVREDGQGFLIRFFRVRNSVIGMCISGDAVLAPLEELTAGGDCLAFICDLDGSVICGPEGFPGRIDLSKNEDFVTLKGERYLQLGCRSEDEDFCIGTWTRPAALYRQMRVIRRLIFAFIAVFVSFMAALTILAQRVLYRPIQQMDTAMAVVAEGAWDYVVETGSAVTEYDNMLRRFNEMVSEIKNLKIDNYEKELDVQRSYLQYLQMQVNPHFYLNALNIIYSMAQVKNYALIQEMTMSLVEYSRYMFRSPKSLVTVQQEMEHVESYMKIQKLRFPERIDFRAEISSEVEDALIPPFVIQNFVENSIKYAVDFEQHSVCAIKGTLIESRGELFVLIEVRDNGRGYREEILELLQSGDWEDGSGRYVGIRNVRKRLQLVFGEKARLILKNEDGAVALILIPLRWREDEEEGDGEEKDRL